MAGWSGRRKNLVVFLFLLPTLLGVLVFNVYPILLNTYISFTNRNKFHPNPDCEAGLNGILDPVCWPMFRENAPKGLGEPYRLQEPITKNYAILIGKLFTVDSILALLRLLLTFVPLIVAAQLNARYEKQGKRPLSSGTLWLTGIAGTIILGWLLKFVAAFTFLMETGDFLFVIFRTLLFVVARVPITFVVGLVLALILNSKHLPGRTFFRVVLFLPWAASSVAILVALIWQFIFREQGVINQVLGVLIQGYKPISWLNNPTAAFAAIVIADIYFSYPFFMVSILGALQSISVDMYEAAEIDGATWWQQLTNITLPLIRPAVLPATVLTSISAFQMFGTAFAITGGGPQTSALRPGATEFVMVYAYRQIYQLQDYGKATAFAVIIFIFLFAVTLWSLRFTRMTKGAYE